MARIQNRTIDEFRPQLMNANKHSRRGMGALESSMRKHGYVAPMTAAADGEIIDGSARIETSADVFGDDVLVVEHDGTKPIIMVRTDIANAGTPEARAIGYEANRIAELNLTWDAEILLADLNAGVDLAGIFDQDELDALLAGLVDDEPVTDPGPQVDKADELRIKWNVSLGQMWQLGDHRLICGDCTDKATVARLMGGEKARYGMQDPPYGISVVGGSKSFGSVGGSNIVRANKYAPIVDDDKPYDPAYILELCPDSVLWGANYYADKLKPSKAWLVWDKKGKEWDDNFSDCELAWTTFAKVTKIYRYLWMGIVQEGPRETRVHPTQKPVGLYVDIMTELFTDDGIILDCYLGSGTTLIACEQLGRQCRAVEISPAYVAVALERWATATNRTPILID